MEQTLIKGKVTFKNATTSRLYFGEFELLLDQTFDDTLNSTGRELRALILTKTDWTKYSEHPVDQVVDYEVVSISEYPQRESKRFWYIASKLNKELGHYAVCIVVLFALLVLTAIAIDWENSLAFIFTVVVNALLITYCAYKLIHGLFIEPHKSLSIDDKEE